MFPIQSPLPKFLLVVALSLGCASAEAARIQVDSAEVEVLPVVDGIVEPGEIRNALELDLVRVGSMDRPEDPTTVSVLASREGIYFAFVCTDRNPAAIASRVMRENGPVFEDDSVQIFLSPNRDVTATNYVHLAVNSAGTLYSNNMQTDSPLTGWKGMARTTGRGWEAEVYVPMRAFGGDLRINRILRGNVSRLRSSRSGSKPERTAWVDPGVSLHNYRRFGFLRITDKDSSQATAARQSAGIPQLDSILNQPIPQVPAIKPAILPAAQATPAPVVQANKSVIVKSLPAEARLVATREIMIATGKDLETVRASLLDLPATVATDLTPDRAQKLQRVLAELGMDVVIN